VVALLKPDVYPNGLADLMNGLSAHPYGKSPQGWQGPQGWDVGPLSGIFELYGSAAGLPLYLTEAGAPDKEVGIAPQAAYLTALFAEAVPQCAAVVWYQLQDYGSEEGFMSFGLQDIDGNDKPALLSFEAVGDPD